MDAYLEKRKHYMFEQYAVSLMGTVHNPVKTFTLESVFTDPYTSRCDVRNFAKLKIGESVAKAASIAWHVRRIK